MIVAHFRGGKGATGRHIGLMGIFIKIAVGAGLAVLTLGVIPDRRRGAVIAIGTCIAAALVLHFVAP